MNINIDDIKRRLLIKYPFFGSIIANTKFKEAKNLETIGTDGKNIIYDPKFLSESNEEKQTFLFAHEVCHIAFNHILRSDGKDKELWNIATDAVINHFLKRDGLIIPEDGISEEKLKEMGFDIEQVINYNSENLYNELLKKKQEQQEQKQNEKNQNKNPDSNNQNSNNSFDNESADQENFSEQGDTMKKNNKIGHDTHDLWEEAVKRFKEGKSLGIDEVSDLEKNESLSENKLSEEQLKEIQDKLSKIDEKEIFKQNEQTRKEQLEELIKSLSKESKNAGTSTNSEVRSINNIGTSKPLIDWRLWLREAISMDVDWSYQNALIEDGVVRLNLETYPIPETEILLDTSGSIHKNLLKNFLRECKNILQASRVKVGCFDTEFYGWNDVRTIEDIDNLEYLGGGGTDFNTAVNAFTKRVENKIIFTDGEAPMPRTSINAIWIVFGGKKISPLGGRVIHITDEQLRKLYYYNEYNEEYRRKM